MRILLLLLLAFAAIVSGTDAACSACSACRSFVGPGPYCIGDAGVCITNTAENCMLAGSEICTTATSGASAASGGMLVVVLGAAWLI